MHASVVNAPWCLQAAPARCPGRHSAARAQARGSPAEAPSSEAAAAAAADTQAAGAARQLARERRPRGRLPLCAGRCRLHACNSEAVPPPYYPRCAPPGEQGGPAAWSRTQSCAHASRARDCVPRALTPRPRHQHVLRNARGRATASQPGPSPGRAAAPRRADARREPQARPPSATAAQAAALEQHQPHSSAQRTGLRLPAARCAHRRRRATLWVHRT